LADRSTSRQAHHPFTGCKQNGQASLLLCDFSSDSLLELSTNQHAVLRIFTKQQFAAIFNGLAVQFLKRLGQIWTNVLISGSPISEDANQPLLLPPISEEA